VLLHGAGSSGRAILELLDRVAAEATALVLAPDSRGATWDAVRGGFGPDVELIERAMDDVLSRTRVDPERTVLAGFSDGASYALSLGLPNGDLFSHIAAFSPGFVLPAPGHGRPPVFVSHGRDDPVLPIDRCSRRIVPALRRAGYDVRYVEFDGGHGIPDDVARAALRWTAAGG
jgi:phospholipase/carboxylesterase